MAMWSNARERGRNMSEAVEKLAKIIKECGSYCVELDGYVLNPSTAACKVLNAGYLPVEPIKLEVLGDDEIASLLGKCVSWEEISEMEKIDLKRIIQATIAHTEAKGQLYRRKEAGDD
jgi:hypothetical protein